MSTITIVDAVHKQIEATGGVLTAIRQENKAGDDDLAATVDSMVMVLDRPLTLRRVVERVVDQQRAGCIPDLFATWQSVCILFELTKHQVYPLRERIKGAQKAGNKVERAEEFERAIRAIEELYHDFRTTFPVATEEEAAEDLAAIARSDHVDAEEAFARIAGVDMETWRRRVLDHLPGRQPLSLF